MTKRSREATDRRDFLGFLGAASIAAACGAESDAADSAGSGKATTGAAGPATGSSSTTSTTSSGGASSGGGGGSGSGVGGAGGEGDGGGGGGAPLACTPSPDNILGPYYRSGAPFRQDLTEAGMAGTRITVTGRVLDPACQPIANALIDLWQADDAGDYDNDGVNDPPPDQFVLRGRMNAGADGAYSFRTVIPGHYLNGAQFRPAHLHVTVSAPGFVSLTTQLYFENDPYNATDAWYLPALELALADAGAEKSSSFDFVLEPV